MKERLQKILAQSTELSRRAAEKAIVAGEVSVNGRVVTELGTQADSYKDKVVWKGKRVRSSAKKIAILYYKPKNVMVTKSDPEGRATIWEKGLKDFKNRLNSAGRLDYDSEGLLILSDNGEFINRLTHPSHEVKKIYEVKVKGSPSKENLDKLREGISYMGVDYLPAKVFLKSKTGTNSWIKVEIHEGKNRQVRKMFEAIGAAVIKLKRTAIGDVRLRNMKPSEWRYLTQAEIKSLC